MREYEIRRDVWRFANGPRGLEIRYVSPDKFLVSGLVFDIRYGKRVPRLTIAMSIRDVEEMVSWIISKFFLKVCLRPRLDGGGGEGGLAEMP